MILSAVLCSAVLSLPAAAQIVPRGVVLTHGPNWTGQSNDPDPVLQEVEAGSSSWYVYALGYASRSQAVLETTAQDKTAAVMTFSIAVAQTGGETWRYTGSGAGTILENSSLSGAGHLFFSYSGSILGMPEASGAYDLRMHSWSTAHGQEDIQLATNQGTQGGSGDPD
ncbi:MAG: hypothetical protein D6702_01860 [Planctomycetota bacterium]|nr:MAG: hypothetical protein D6702_01860 [Planctomycetota bacterium]